MGSGDNKCVACGQWAGKGHKCPTPDLPVTSTLTSPPSGWVSPPDPELTDRLRKANAHLAQLAKEPTPHPPLNPVHATPLGLTTTQQGVYPDDADPDIVAELRQMPVRLVVVDIETTGFDPNSAQTTEIAWESLNSGDAGTFIPPHTLDGADPDSLRISRYEERIAGQPQDNGDQVRALHAFLGGDGTKTHVVGSNPSFDCAHLNTLFAKYGLPADPWNHRKIDPAAAAYWMYSDVPLGAQTGLKESTAITGVELDGHHAAGVDVTATTRIWHRLEARRKRLS